MVRRFAGFLAGAVAALALPLSAAAQSTFHVKEFDYKQGDWVIETINAYQGLFRPRSERTQWGHEIGIGYAVSDFWTPKVLISFDKEQREAYEVQRLLFENTFTFKQLEEKRDGIGFAWFQSVEGALTDRQTNATAFGPMVTAQLGKFSISTNTFFEKTFGQNREEGVNFFFAGQARYEIMDKVKLGFEAYTFVPEIGARNQTPNTGLANRIGPVLIIEVDLPRGAEASRPANTKSLKAGTAGVQHVHAGGDAPHAEIEVGVLFGTTEYTPDTTGKVNVHFRF
jgi:hypothetical protein